MTSTDRHATRQRELEECNRARQQVLSQRYGDNYNDNGCTASDLRMYKSFKKKDFVYNIIFLLVFEAISIMALRMFVNNMFDYDMFDFDKTTNYIVGACILGGSILYIVYTIYTKGFLHFGKNLTGRSHDELVELAQIHKQDMQQYKPHLRTS